MFRYIETNWEILEIPLQALEIAAISRKQGSPKNEKSVSSWGRDSDLVKSEDISGWGKLLEIPKKKDGFGLDYKPVNKEV